MARTMAFPSVLDGYGQVHLVFGEMSLRAPRRMRFKQVLALGLIGCLLFVSGSLLRQAAPHAVHHAHHKSSTHSSLLCLWLCTAGELHEGVDVVVQRELSPLELLTHLTHSAPPTILTMRMPARGPPAHHSS